MTNPPMGGSPYVPGDQWLNICAREDWNVDLAFRFLGVIEGAFSEAVKREPG